MYRGKRGPSFRELPDWLEVTPTHRKQPVGDRERVERTWRDLKAWEWSGAPSKGSLRGTFSACPAHTPSGKYVTASKGEVL